MLRTANFDSKPRQTLGMFPTRPIFLFFIIFFKTYLTGALKVSIAPGAKSTLWWSVSLIERNGREKDVIASIEGTNHKIYNVTKLLQMSRLYR